MLQFWFPKNEFFKFLQPMMGYSEFCRRWILKGIETEFSNEFKQEQIKIKKQEIKDLESELKTQTFISSKAKEILQQWFQLFKGERRQFTEPKFNKDWIKTKIIPELASAGCTAFDEGQVLDVFMDHYNHNKEVIIID